MSDMNKDCTGAGVIVYTKELDRKDHEDCVHYLVLKLDHYLDLPKGGIDHGEDFVSAATRETQEECNLKAGSDYVLEEDFICFSGDRLAMYLGKYNMDPSDPYRNVNINRNEKTGVYEHDDAVWLTLKEIMSGAHGQLYPYLNKPLLVAEDYIFNNSKV